MSACARRGQSRRRHENGGELWRIFTIASALAAARNPATVMLGAAVTAVVLQRSMRNPLRFETLRDFAFFVRFAVILIPAVFALIATAARDAGAVDFWTTMRQWAMGEALAQLTVVPAIVYWVFGAAWQGKTLNNKTLVEAAVLTAE